MREIKQIVEGLKSSDGDGVQLTRVIGSSSLNMLDPFLLFDAFGSDKPQDYIGGFPSHPHRGFETVTYMLTGKMLHQDSAGNAGVIESGGVQWMTAGRGIIHSEMPQQKQGMLAGFQLWVNLPAAHKMTMPKYQERSEAQIPEDVRVDGSSIKVIAGETSAGIRGVIENTFIDPVYWDVHLAAGGELQEALPLGHNGFIYLIEGNVSIGNSRSKLNKGQLGVLTDGEKILINSTDKSRFLVVAGKPLNEPVERAGPFVMNTRKEIEQAFADYRAGRLA